MRCPYCHRNIRVSGRFCPQCGRQIFGLPVGPGSLPPSSQPPPPSAANLEPPTQTASAGVAGKICPYDQYPIAVGDPIIICPACRVPHHADCWRENGGCTTYGCIQGPAQVAHAAAQAGAASTSMPSSPGAMDRPPYLAFMAMEAERNATNALLYALIGLPCCPVLSIVAFFMAVAVFGALERTGLDSPGARMKATWAIVIGALGPVAWIVFLLAALAAGASY